MVPVELKGEARHWTRLIVPWDVVVQLIRPLNLPKSFRIVAVETNYEYAALSFVLEHESFPAVYPFELIPERPCVLFEEPTDAERQVAQVSLDRRVPEGPPEVPAEPVGHPPDPDPLPVEPLPADDEPPELKRFKGGLKRKSEPPK